MTSKLKQLYLFQRQDMSLEAAIEEVENEFAETERGVEKVVHEHHGYSIEYTIPVFDEEIHIFPVDQAFVDHLLRERYTLDDFPTDQREIMEKLMNQLTIGSFIIELPGNQSEKNREYLVKLMGIALGGYYGKLSDIPSHGLLNKKEHIYIKPFRKQDEDIIDNLETLLKKYA